MSKEGRQAFLGGAWERVKGWEAELGNAPLPSGRPAGLFKPYVNPTEVEAWERENGATDQKVRFGVRVTGLKK